MGGEHNQIAYQFSEYWLMTYFLLFGPPQPGPRDAISSEMILNTATTWYQRQHFEGPLSGRLRQVTLYTCLPCWLTACNKVEDHRVRKQLPNSMFQQNKVYLTPRIYL